MSKAVCKCWTTKCRKLFLEFVDFLFKARFRFDVHDG